MASERLETAEKIMRMVEWSDTDPWEYAESEAKVKDPLAMAKRYVSAQAFLLSWQEGKVPTGWRRPRRLVDFDGKYPQPVLDSVNEKMAQKFAERNQEKTAQINAVLNASAKGRDSNNNTLEDNSNKGNENNEENASIITKKKKSLSKSDVDAVKKDLAQFSHAIFEAKSALRIASNTAAEAALHIAAISSALSKQ